MEGTIVGAGGGELPLPKFFFFHFQCPTFCCCFVVFVFKQNLPKVKNIILCQLVCLTPKAAELELMWPGLLSCMS